MRILFALLLLIAPAAQAQSIIATVNDDAITSTDVEGRVRLALLGSGIKPDAATIEKLRGQVLRGLIDERLQQQEVSRIGLSVEDKDIEAEKARLAAQNNLKPEQLAGFFAKAHVPMSALEEQIRAKLLWTKIIQRVLRPEVNVSDAEIDAEIARLNANAGKPEYLVAEIFLPVDRADQQEKVRLSATRLFEQISHGARFSVIARQFSQAPSAAASGDIGWVQPGQFEPEIDKALAQMKPGTVSPPIRTASGYTLLMLRETRLAQGAGVEGAAGAPKVTLRQVSLPLAQGASPAEVKQAAEKLEAQRKQAKNCNDMAAFAKTNGTEAGGDLGTVEEASLAATARTIVAGLKVNEAGPLMKNEEGALFLMVCARTAPAVGEATEAARGRIINKLGTQKLEVQARRYLRDLRQNAFIEVRG